MSAEQQVVNTVLSEMSHSDAVVSNRLKTPTPSLHPRSTQPVGLALFCQQSLSSHSTPPSHYSAADCSSSSHHGGSFNCRFCALALVQVLQVPPALVASFTWWEGFPILCAAGNIICISAMYVPSS